MTVLEFEHGGYKVVTSAWTACDKGSRVDVCYLWASGPVGVARLKFEMTMDEFIRRVKSGGVVTL
jgi:hypothetical protein